MNQCDTSEVSDSFTTTVYTSAGLGENINGQQLIIYPNPTEGNVTVKLPVQKTFTGDVTITDANGAIVMSRSGLTIPSGDVTTLDLGSLSEGVYSVKLSSNQATYSGRIIVK
jgi:hypothetical protein